MTYDGLGAVRRRDPWMTRVLRGLSGVVSGGVVALTAVVLGAAYLASDRDFPGPGAESIAAHVLASVLVVGLQVYSDRRRAGASFAASTAVLVVTALLLWTQWWS